MVHAVAVAQDLRTFANDAEGFSGADLASLAREAASMSRPCLVHTFGPFKALLKNRINMFSLTGKPFFWDGVI